MATPKISRILSTFSSCTRRWVPTPPGLPTVSQNLTNISLSTWNINAFSPRPVARTSAMIDHLLTRPSTTCDIIFLQEVSREVRAYLLCNVHIRAGFFITDAEDEIALNGVPFTTMTLLSKAWFTSFTARGNTPATPVTRFKFPSQYGRDALCTDVSLPLPKSGPLLPEQQQTWQRLRLLNLHLDSLASTLHYRKEQMSIVGRILRRGNDEREDGQRSIGLMAGDCNAISQEDQELIPKNGLIDAWSQLHGNDTAKSEGWTWRDGNEKRRDKLPLGRLDRVATTAGLEPIEMHIIHPGTIKVPRPGREGDGEVRWSDHAGLNCRFQIGC